MIIGRSISPDRVYLALSHLLFLGLFALAAIHFEARTIHVDSAFQIVKWIQQDTVQVEAHRYTAVLPQILVKVGVGLGFELATLLLLASLSHVTVGYGVFLLAAHVCRTPWIAIAGALATVLCTRLTFYGIVLEANYLLSYPFLLAAVLHGPLQRRVTPWTVGAAVVALFLVLLVHPVGFLIALFVIGLAYLRMPAQRSPLRVLFFLALAWGVLGRVLLPPSGYESSLYTSAFDGLAEAGGIARSASFAFLQGHTWHDTTLYLPLWVLSGGLAVWLMRRREWSILGLFVLGFIGYALLNIITYRSGETAMMMEKNFVPLATLVLLPWAFEMERGTLRAKWWALAPFVCIAFLQFRGISFASRPANERVDLLGILVEQARDQGARKVALRAADLDGQGLHIHWALPYETLLLSGLQGPSSTISAVALGPEDPVPTTTEVLLAPLDDPFPTDRSKIRYFALPQGPYVLLSWPNK